MKDKPKTIEVMFRKYRDKSAEILAVFPYVPHNRAQTLVACYAHDRPARKRADDARSLRDPAGNP